ncbi:MAG: PRC-barrel domain-containing protein [Candidatus Tectimicrobiota bacterium]
MHVRWILVALVWVCSPGLLMRGEAASPDVTFPLYKIQDVLTKEVTTAEGKETGQIENVVLDAATGDLLYIIVRSGTVLGLGGTAYVLPWDALQGSAESKPFTLQISAEEVARAPRFDKDDWPEMLDRHWLDAFQVYYGGLSHLGKRLPPNTNVPVAQGPRPVLMAASVLQGQVMNLRGQRLGAIKDLVIESQAGRVLYVVLAVRDFPQREKWFALPWQSLQQSKGLGTFILQVDAKVLEDAPGFNQDQWPTQAQHLGSVSQQGTP